MDSPQQTSIPAEEIPIIKPWTVEEYQEPPEDAFPTQLPAVAVPAAVISSILETMNLLDEFFRRHASTTTRAELRTFAALQGWHPAQGAEVLIESIGLHARSLTRALDTSHTDQH